VGLFDQVIRINITPRQNLIIAALHMTVAQSAFVKKPFDIYWPPILVTMQPDTGGESLKQIILIGIPESIVVLIIVIVFGGGRAGAEGYPELRWDRNQKVNFALRRKDGLLKHY
jgi:hypothetical protein